MNTPPTIEHAKTSRVLQNADGTCWVFRRATKQWILIEYQEQWNAFAETIWRDRCEEHARAMAAQITASRLRITPRMLHDTIAVLTRRFVATTRAISLELWIPARDRVALETILTCLGYVQDPITAAWSRKDGAP